MKFEYQIIDTRKEDINMKYRVTIRNYYTVLQKAGKCTSIVLRHFNDRNIAEKFSTMHNNAFTSTEISEVPDSEAVDDIIYSQEE